MAAVSHRRHLKRFIISGMPDGPQLETLKQQMRSLGGKVEDNGKNNFMSLCTHVIVRDFNLTEKVLGGLASGKWIVPYKYIIDSHREGRWLDEREYEMTNMARKCRLRYLSHGGGIYSGWKIYIKMENITMTKSFRRIVAAGGAEILSHKEISHSDLIIADKKMAVFVQASVGPNIPIVMFTYIKDTIVKGADPCNLSPYLLEGNGIAHLAKKVDLTTPQRSNSYIPKRPQNEVQTNESKKVCTKVKPDTPKRTLLSASYQQSRLDQYIQIDSPGRTTPTSSPTKRTPSSSRKRRFLLSQVTPEKQPTISKFFVKKEATSDSDVQCITESPREKRGLNNNRISECDSDCLITEVVKSESTNKHKYHIREDVDDIKKEDIKNAIRRRMGLTDVVLSKRTNVRERLEKISDSNIIDLTLCNNENSRVLTSVSFDSDVHDDIEEIGESVTNNESPGIKSSVSTDSSRQSELSCSTVQVCDSEISVFNDIRTDELITGIPRRDSKVCLERVEAHVPKRSSSLGSDLPSVPQTIRGDSGIMNGLLKKVTVNIGPRIDEWMFPTSFIGKGKVANSSETFEQDRGQQMKLSKEVVKKNIGTFIKKSKMVNGIYCGSVAMCSEGMAKEVNGMKKSKGESLGSGSAESHISPEVRELNVEEISYYESSIDQVMQGVEMFPTEEQSILMTGLDTLYLSITPYTYLPSSLFGDLLRRLVLETEFKEIHSLALNLAHKILSLHPPNNPHWKNYYFETMIAAMQTHEVGSFRAWRFIRSVIESLHMEDRDEDMSDAESDEPSTKMENVLGLLNFFILVLREDMKNFQRRENVCSLLCWKVFWGQSGNPMIVSPPVKQLLRLWVSMQAMSPAARQCIANLVCIVLELVWKFERLLLLPASPLPTSLAPLRTEFLLQIRDIGSDQCLKLLQDFSSPWPKMVVSAFIFQEITNIHNQKINLSDIVEYSQTLMLKQESAQRPSSPEVSPTISSKSPVKKIRLGQNINKRNAKGETALIRACINNDVQRVQELLKVPGIDVNLADHCGWTAMHEAAIRGHTECVKLLLKFNCYDSFGAKNLMYLSCKRVSERGSIMVNLSAKGGKDEQTPLHDAVIHNNYETVKILLDYGGKSLLSEENRLGQTPLDLAKTDEMKKLLVSHARDSSSSGHSGNSGRSYHLKATIFASALSKPQGLFPCLEDRLALSIQYVNSYLETSGTRSIHFQIQRNFRHSAADRGVHKSGHPMIIDLPEKRSSIGSDMEGTEGESVQGEASSSSCPTPAEAKSEVLCDEESLAGQLYGSVWMDLKLYNRCKERKRPLSGVPQNLQELICLFD